MYKRRSKWPNGLKRGSAADRLLGLRIRIPPGAWMFVSCVCYVLSGRGLCDGPITCPEESYRLWCIIVCDAEKSRMRRPWPSVGCCASEETIFIRFSYIRTITEQFPKCYILIGHVIKPSWRAVVMTGEKFPIDETAALIKHCDILSNSENGKAPLTWRNKQEVLSFIGKQ